MKRMAVRPLTLLVMVATLAACSGLIIGPGPLSTSSAVAADQHVLDPALSLTGDCSAAPPDVVPDPDCVGNPPAYPPYKPNPFKNPCGSATDSHGYIYVASIGNANEGWIDVFDSAGRFVTLINTGNEGLTYACRLDIDSNGRIYISVISEGGVYRFTPKAYPPPKEAGAYGTKELPFPVTGGARDVAVDSSNDHIFVATGPVFEYEPTGAFIDSVGGSARYVGVWAKNHDVYMKDLAEGGVRIYDGTLDIEKESIDIGSPGGGALAVDQENGDLYVHVCPTKDCEIRQFGIRSETGDFELVNTFGQEQGLQDATIDRSDLTVDSAVEGNPDYDSPNEGYVFVNSGGGSGAHNYAFAPLEIGPPVISGQAVSQVATSSATLEGVVQPSGADTDFQFEYISQAKFAELGWSGASTVGTGQIPADAPSTSVNAPIAGLEPDTEYRFRITATNKCNPLEPEEQCVVSGERNEADEEVPSSFATYSLVVEKSCPNDAFRTGPSAVLPDCRAFELVTPAQTDGHLPVWTQGSFDSSLVTAGGDRLAFASETGPLPGFEGNGYFNAYQGMRTPGGWTVEGMGPSGHEAGYAFPNGLSPEHDLAVWEVLESYKGSLVDPRGTRRYDTYLRQADGSYLLVGRGEPGFDDAPDAEARWITSGGEHLIFTTAGIGVPLRSDAPSAGTGAVYDRTPNGLHTVSLLPGNVTPGDGETASYLGTSVDGNVVAFGIGSSVYVRRDNTNTIKIGDSLTFAGLSDVGDRLFYLDAGNIFAFDLNTELVSPVGTGGESTLVIPSPDGSRVYFASPKELDGDSGQVGEPNLYLWDEGIVQYVATLVDADFEGPVSLGAWLGSSDATTLGPAARSGSALDPARVTADGSVLVFESHADLDPPLESGGHSQIYRFDVTDNSLSCISCAPTKVTAVSDARLQRMIASEDISLIAPLTAAVPVQALTEDGQRAFFESDERLVLRDTDGLTDVYEWRAAGIDGCQRDEGCLGLMSSGQSASADSLYAVAPDGSDVFIRTADSLVPSDTDGGEPSLYDVRVGGGFSSPPSANGCEGSACQPVQSGPPAPLGVPSADLRGPNVTKRPKPKKQRCNQRKRKGKSSRKASCGRKRNQGGRG